MGLFRRKKKHNVEVRYEHGRRVEYHTMDADVFKPNSRKSSFQRRRELSKIKKWYKDGIQQVAVKEYGKALECFRDAFLLNNEFADSWYNEGNMSSLLENILTQIEDKEYAWRGDGNIREEAPSLFPAPITTRDLDDMQRKWLELPHTTSLETLQDCIRVLGYLERGKNDPYRISTENS
uniref:TPR repeat-containing protein n=1 Tax=uncultured marine thaumarchaeote SAT1000_53_A12 TaxID=1456422 RepID=A0A075IFA1_9ARCH|nr:hypothetical protein [uncultured marine thaumarchaeote SAT1000_53_A12]